MRCLRTGCRGEPGPCLLLAAEQPAQSECTVCRAVAIRLQRSDKQRVVPVRLFGGAARGQLAGAFRRLTIRFLFCLLLAGTVNLVNGWLSVFLAGVLL